VAVTDRAVIAHPLAERTRLSPRPEVWTVRQERNGEHPPRVFTVTMRPRMTRTPFASQPLMADDEHVDRRYPVVSPAP